jgi:hypothetical protein
MMHGKFKDMPACFDRTNISTIDVFLDFIDLLLFPYLHSGEIVAFINILVDVLDSLDRSTYFNIYVTVIFGREERAVRDDVSVVKDISFTIGVGATIVWPGILWIAIISKASFIAKHFWIVLATLTINHAFLWSAGTMKHAHGNSLVQHWMGNWVSVRATLSRQSV